MAVSSVDTLSGPYTTNGVTTTFPFTFKAMAESEVRVFRIASTGVETEISDGAYDVTLDEDGGSVIFTVAPTAGDPLYIGTNPDFTQQITFENQGAFLPEVMNEAFDRAATRDLALKGAVDRSIRFPLGEQSAILPPAADRAHKYLAFDGNAQPIATEAVYDLRLAADVAQIDTQNLFRNTDFTLGNPNNVLVPNDALDAVGPTYWVAQQTGLNPFVSIQRFFNADGLYTIRMINGLPSFSSRTIGTGSKTFEVAAGLNFAAGIDVTIAYADDPINKKMVGTITSYSGTTLTVNVTSVTGSGTYANWYIGRNGVTNNATPVYNTTTASAAAGTNVLTFASTATIEIGANLEEAVGNGVAKATYVVSKTATTVTLSKNLIGPGVANGQQMTTYGDQGWYLYQNIDPADAGSFKMGTPEARTSYISFKVRSRHVGGMASIMALGYSSLYTLGRSYAAPFAVTEEETVVTVPIFGDTVPTANTWQAGYDATDWPYLGVGFAWVSRGTNTSKNIPPYEWSNAFAVAGAQGQTLDLASVVGAWVEVSEVKFGFSVARDYYAPTTLDHPAPVRHLRAPSNPRLLLEGTRNAAGKKKAQAYLDSEGRIVFQALADNESSGFNLLRLGRNGEIYPLAYADGRLAVLGGQMVTTPDTFTAYTPGAVTSSGSSTFGTRTGRYIIEGKRVYVQLSITVTNVGTGAGFVIADLPIAAVSKEYALMGFDTGFTGNPIFGRVVPGGAAVQIKLINGAFPAQNGSVLNLSGFYETA